MGLPVSLHPSARDRLRGSHVTPSSAELAPCEGARGLYHTVNVGFNQTAQAKDGLIAEER